MLDKRDVKEDGRGVQKVLGPPESKLRCKGRDVGGEALKNYSPREKEVCS